MKKFNVEQTVLCEVNVQYVIEAETHEEALVILSSNKSPTSVDGVDYEIISDVRILNTKMYAVKDLKDTIC